MFKTNVFRKISIATVVFIAFIIYKCKLVVGSLVFTIVKKIMFTFVNMKNTAYTPLDFLAAYSTVKNQNLTGRYLRFEEIKHELDLLQNEFKITSEGISVLGTAIPSVEIGQGSIKILAWSQMHGNESTTTKAVFDIFNFLKSKNSAALAILEACTITIIPMLNPDGADSYTRENANGIDLNRDAFMLQEPESRILRQVFDEFQPDFCLNLHDQRTIYSAGKLNQPATLSFLAPAMDENRNINKTRKKAMAVISAVEKDIQPFLKNKIGRYDDAFNKNCTGDTFTTLNVPTILFEAGHFPKDYQREETRKYVAVALFSTLKNLSTGSWSESNYNDYFSIPENEKLFYDVVLRNVALVKGINDVGIQFEEVLNHAKIEFIPKIDEISSKINRFGHQEFECEGEKVFSFMKIEPKIGDVVQKIKLKASYAVIKEQ